MPDMIVNLKTVEAARAPFADTIEIRRAMIYERHRVLPWIETHFSAQWADECAAGFCGHPVACFIALDQNSLCGFCCYDCTFRGFAGPIGVATGQRRKGVGRALLLAALRAMQNLGYGYAVIGAVAVPDFFRKSVGAILIQDGGANLYPKKMN